MLFTELNLIKPILDAVTEEGYTTPTPIQQQAIPEVLKGRDLLGCAQTGTGKTAAFAIPILQLMMDKKRKDSHIHPPIKTLVITPTRELAIQIQESFEAYGRHLRLSNAVIFGGVKQHGQVQQLQNGVDILVATPGRLLDLINQRIISLAQIEIFVLDEADRMLDMGFVNDVNKVIKLLPPKRQTLFFSATMPDEIRGLANEILNNPVKVEVAPVSSTADTIKQFLYFVNKKDKPALLAHVLQNTEMDTVLVFTRTKHGADKVVKFLRQKGIIADAIHGNKSQNARQNALSKFKDREIRVLVATDIASRGIDVDELEYVINYDLPEVPETYVHRIGRSGRAGNKGMSLSFCDAEEMDYLKQIHKLIRKDIPEVQDHPFREMFTTVVTPKPPVQDRRPKQPSQSGSRNNRQTGYQGNRSAQPSNQPENRQHRQMAGDAPKRRITR